MGTDYDPVFLLEASPEGGYFLSEMPYHVAPDEHVMAADLGETTPAQVTFRRRNGASEVVEVLLQKFPDGETMAWITASALHRIFQKP